jgi:deoxyadenosine/deoxycytidine kinase
MSGRRFEPRYIAVEGPPGAGVSALARALAASLDATLAADPAPGNPFLEDFARDPHRFGFQAQVFCLLARYRQQLELAQPGLFAPTRVVADYLFARDALFARTTLSAHELELYGRVHQLLSPQLPRPDFVVYLTANREVSRNRVRRAVAPADRVIELQVIDQLAEEMDDYFFRYRETPLLVINTSEFDVIELPRYLEELIDIIKKARPGVQHYRPIGPQ